MNKRDPALLVEEARDEYADENIQIDDNAAISYAENGAWVAAWVWLANPEVNDRPAESPAPSAPLHATP